MYVKSISHFDVFINLFDFDLDLKLGELIQLLYLCHESAQGTKTTERVSMPEHCFIF